MLAFLKKNIFFIIILAAGALPRLYGLGQSDLQTDVAKYALGIDWPHSFLVPSLMVISQKIFGMSEFAARLPIALFSIATLAVYYFLGKDFLGGKKAGLIAMSLGAILPFNIIISRQGFLDPALVFGIALTYYLWLKYEQSDTRMVKAGLFLSILALPWFKIQAVFAYFVLGLYILIKNKGRFWQDQRFFLLLAAGLAFLVYLASQPEQAYAFLVYEGPAGFSPAGTAEFLKLIWQSYGPLLVLALGAGYLIVQNKKLKTDNIYFLSLLHILVHAIFLNYVIKQDYYYILPDFWIIVSLSYLLLLVLGNLKTFHKAGLIVVILLNSAYVLFYLNNCLKPGSFELMFRQSAEEINGIILNTKEPRLVYLDPGLGFQAKWALKEYVTKIEHLEAHPDSEEARFILAYERHLDKYENYFPSQEVYKFDGLIMVKELK